MEQTGPDHFRFYTELGPKGVTIKTERFVVVGETPRCWYVIEDYFLTYGLDFIKSKRRRVLKDSHKRYCYPDRDQALLSFMTRQSWRLTHAERAKAQADLSLAAARAIHERGEDVPDVIECGHNEYTARLRWNDW